MKAHYYLSQAQLCIGDHESALSSAQHAHAICAAHNDKSLIAVTNAVLRAKKARWDHAEKLRVREEADLERDVLRLLRRECEEDVAAAVAQADDMEVQVVTEEASRKEERVRRVFERARRKAEERREVPDWAVDDISFGIMVDPVIVSLLALPRSLVLSRERNCFSKLVSTKVNDMLMQFVENRPKQENHTKDHR